MKSTLNSWSQLSSLLPRWGSRYWSLENCRSILLDKALSRCECWAGMESLDHGSISWGFPRLQSRLIACSSSNLCLFGRTASSWMHWWFEVSLPTCFRCSKTGNSSQTGCLEHKTLPPMSSEGLSLTGTSRSDTKYLGLILNSASFLRDTFSAERTDWQWAYTLGYRSSFSSEWRLRHRQPWQAMVNSVRLITLLLPRLAVVVPLCCWSRFRSAKAASLKTLHFPLDRSLGSSCRSLSSFYRPRPCCQSLSETNYSKGAQRGSCSASQPSSKNPSACFQSTLICRIRPCSSRTFGTPWTTTCGHLLNGYGSQSYSWLHPRHTETKASYWEYETP